VAFTQKIVKRYDPTNFDAVQNRIVPVVNDTIRGFFYGQAINPSISMSFNPQVFGLYDFSETRPNSRLQSIRHVIKPAIGFSFIPSFSGLSSRNMYRQVQVDTIPNYLKYSIYDGNIYPTPSLGSKSGNISFSLVNIVEAKVFERNDTTGKPKKVKLIDNFSVNTSYNVFADKFHWAPVTMQVRTTLMKNISISANGSFSLYDVDTLGIPVNKFLIADHKGLMRLTNFGTSIDFSLSDLLRKDKTKNKSGPGNTQNNPGQASQSFQDGLPGSNVQGQTPAGAAGLKDAYGYPVFDVPWTLNISYSLSYIKSGLRSTLTQALSLNNGSITLTKKMSATFTTGYDFTGKRITMTQIGITRDLHCWQMAVNWVPNGTMQSWNFLIRVKAAVLGDLKYERRKDFHDTY
jgi:hypothetical protein